MLDVVRMLERLNMSNSKNDKIEILKEYEPIRYSVLYAMDPYKKYNITSKRLNIQEGEYHVSWSLVRRILDDLINKKYTGNAAIKHVELKLDNVRKDQIDAFKKILDKNLEAGIGVPTVNKVWKGFILTFDVQLCEKYEDLDKVPFKLTLSSRKLDGVRTISIRENGEWLFMSRAGKEFDTLDKLRQHLIKNVPGNNDLVLDGEVCIHDENGLDDFAAVMKQIKRKDHSIENPKFYVFDLITLQEFKDKKGLWPFSMRYSKMQDILVESDMLHILEQTTVTSPEHLQELQNEAIDNGWEGIILKDGDSAYTGKRSKQILKVKKFIEHEFKIVDFQEGERHIKGMLGALIVEGEYNGKMVRSKVGSGFDQKWHKDLNGKVNFDDPNTNDERYKFWKNRKEILGQIVTVKFFEVTTNQEGGHSLRFPIFRCLHGDERSV